MNTPQYRFSRHSHHFVSRDLEPTIWQRLHIDPWLSLLLISICFIGLTVLYSASTQDVAMVTRQAVSYGIAFTVMLVMAQLPQLLSHADADFLCAWAYLARAGGADW